MIAARNSRLIGAPMYSKGLFGVLDFGVFMPGKDPAGGRLMHPPKRKAGGDSRSSRRRVRGKAIGGDRPATLTAGCAVATERESSC